jgi:integrase
MKARYRLIRRGIRGNKFYCVDTTTGKRTSLGTASEEDAKQVIEAKNNSQRQPVLNLQIAKAYLAGSDNGMTTRTWQNAIESLMNTKHGANLHRWQTAAKDKALATLLPQVIIETKGEMILKVLQMGTVSTNVYLRRLHNFCVDMNWLPWPLVPKRQWPAVEFKEKRSITLTEHQAIVEREQNPERKAFYKLAWYLGASQTDLAELNAEDVDWENNVISYARRKTGSIAIMRLDNDMAEILRDLPGTGPLFPYLRTVRSGDRATEFKQRCNGLGIKGVTLHSYRYAWAERAKTAGYPERFAQVNIGHNSKAMARAYSRKAPVEMPALSEYERQQKAIIAGPKPQPATQTVAVQEAL